MTGNLYEMSSAFYDDFGGPLRAIRIAPHLTGQAVRTTYASFQIDLDVGVGPSPPLLDTEGNPRDPMVNLSWSDDGAKTWSNIYATGFGQQGKFLTRAIWRRLGQSRDRVFQVEVSDPVPAQMVAAYVDAQRGIN